MNSYQLSYQHYTPDVEQCYIPYQIYYVNNYPYVCNYLQPDILMPLYIVQNNQNLEKNVRFAAELVSAVGNVVENQVTNQVTNQVSSLENYVKKMEEETTTIATEQIKTSCYGFCK